MKLVFATNNAHKVSEVVAALTADNCCHEVQTLDQCGIVEEIPETEPTLEGNAQLKARFVAQRLRAQGETVAVFADDTGLEIDALNGAPGVFSARYSGGGSEKNIDKVLRELCCQTDRKAQFRTVICLIAPDGKESLFEGVVRGEILDERNGDKGFGYDSIFRPDGHQQSFAQMPLDAKNRISHRGRAIAAMSRYLASNNE